MTKQLSLALAAGIALTTLFSCKSKSTTTPATTYIMTADVDAGSFTGQADASVFADSTLLIVGSSPTTATTFPQINLEIAKWSGGIVTKIFDSSIVNSARYNANDTSSSLAKTGSVSITAVSSTTVTGTFAFTTYSGRVINGGKFTALRH